MDGWWSGFATGITATVVIGMFAMTAAVELNRDNYWNQGYCSAQGGEILSSDICAKDGQIIPIPPRP